MIKPAEDVPALTQLQCDLCIIGSGAAGISVAREFIGTPVTVFVLEGGGDRPDPGCQDPYQSLVTGLKHEGIHIGRMRAVGGTTTLWAGQALPLFDIDFQRRDWVPFSGWPIERQSLIPFYERAEKVLQIPHVTYDPSTWPEKRTPPEYDRDRFVSYFSQFTSTPNFSAKYRKDIDAATNVTLFTHANVISLEANPSAKRINAVRAKTFAGSTFSVNARQVVVCCGGIESAKLLLVSNSVESNGIGNSFDVVGRYFQDHPGFSFPVKPLNRLAFKRSFVGIKKNGIRYSFKSILSDKLQRENRLLHVGGEVFYPQTENDPIQSAKAVLQALRGRRTGIRLSSAIGNIARRPDKVVRSAFQHFVLRQPASIGSTQPHLGIGGEQQPNPNSRVMLSDQKDILGVPRTRLEWKLTEAETRSMQFFTRSIAEEWRRLGLAEIKLDQIRFSGRENGEHGGYVDSNHHIGTTRMGTDPNVSVVDPDCRVHGYENLYIGSSAVFPTGGFSNPTLTVIALCLRIADDVKQRLAHDY